MLLSKEKPSMRQQFLEVCFKRVELHYERKHEIMTQKNVLRLGYNIFVSYISVMLFMAIVVTLGFYRKWKIEQEIEGLLWKINIESLLVSNTIYQGD